MKKYLWRIVPGLLLFCAHAASSGAWTLDKGEMWLKTSFFYQKTNSRFCSEQDALSPAFQSVGCTAAGNSAPFDPFIGGNSRASAIFFDAHYGVLDKLEVGLQIPLYSLQFTNLADPDRPVSTGLGDFRFSGKLNFLQKPFTASLTLTAKAPTGSFNTDAEVINISEGQWDYETGLEVGKSLWPVPGYVNASAGYRMRSDNPDFEFEFADEVDLGFEAGLSVRDFILIKTNVHWLRGQRPVLKLSGDQLLWRRELLTLMPAVLVSISNKLNFESAVKIPLKGQDYPDGAQYIAAFSYKFKFFD